MVIGVFFGAFIWLLFELNKAFKKENFSYKTFFQLNIIPFITNIVCGLVLVWAKDDIKEFFVITKFSSVVLGMAGQGIFKKIFGIFYKNIETHIGLNKSSK